ncbi:unnamed protein product [Rotaria sp. Silwood2]|nr:unnamed protein product [Rotaria sp. Silwood2]CAF2964383.1 unnamed protein product [Rotaria sp. Silwood2]CAF4058976.1 unnamed protein product [Rotaria sp. Silwood2]CAF4340570.1 unnamed protein product [Rotaria sp. Silwood2]
MVYASTIHAVTGYLKDVQAKTNEPSNPVEFYGVTKCFGEAFCRYMSEKEGVPSIAVYVGAFQPHSTAQNKDSINLKFGIVHGLSRNIFNRMDIESTRQLLSYELQDNFF